MSNRLQQITIDINSDNNFQYVRAIQGDANGYLAEITIVADGIPYEIDQSKTATLRGTKPDGKQIFNTCEITENNTILIKSTEQLTSTLGRSKYEISFYGKNNPSGETTFPFYIVVVESAVNAKTVVSSNEFTALQEAFSTADSKLTLMDQGISNMNETLDTANTTISDMNNLKSEVTSLKNTIETNESDRNSNESIRQSQEEKRQNDTRTALDTLESEKNAAIKSMEDKTELEINSMQSKTQTALNNIATAISNSETATSNADKATERANKAASDCENIVSGTGLVMASEKGVANGIATLDENGFVPSAQLSLTNDSVGLGNVENKNSETIRGEITSKNVTDALGFTPEDSNAVKVNTSITVLASGWSENIPYTQTITVDGLHADSKYSLFIKLFLSSDSTSESAKALKKNYGFIDYAETTENGLKLTCYNKKPTIDIPVVLKEV